MTTLTSFNKAVAETVKAGGPMTLNAVGFKAVVETLTRVPMFKPGDHVSRHRALKNGRPAKRASPGLFEVRSVDAKTFTYVVEVVDDPGHTYVVGEAFLTMVHKADVVKPDRPVHFYCSLGHRDGFVETEPNGRQYHFCCTCAST